MKINASIAASFLIVSLVSTQASNIIIPSGNFTNITTTISVPPLLGNNSGPVGSWSGQISSLVSASGSIRCGVWYSLSGPAPMQGTYEMDVHLPVGLGTSASVGQVLTNCWQPNSTYTLTVGLSEGGTANLLSGSTLALQQGTTNVAMVSGTTLVGLLNGASAMKAVTLTYKTGNKVPTNGIGISLSLPSTLSVGGDAFVNGFQLSVVPNQVVLTSTINGHGGSSTINLSGTGGAPGQTFEIITTTNLAYQQATWNMFATNQFDSNGNFSIQVPVVVTTHHRFFSLVLP